MRSCSATVWKLPLVWSLVVDKEIFRNEVAIVRRLTMGCIMWNMVSNFKNFKCHVCNMNSTFLVLSMTSKLFWDVKQSMKNIWLQAAHKLIQIILWFCKGSLKISIWNNPDRNTLCLSTLRKCNLLKAFWGKLVHCLLPYISWTRLALNLYASHSNIWRLSAVNLLYSFKAFLILLSDFIFVVLFYLFYFSLQWSLW